MRHPTQIVSQHARRAVQERIEEIEVPIKGWDKRTGPAKDEFAHQPQSVASTLATSNLATPVGIPLQSNGSAQIIKQKLAGQRSRYQIEQLLQEHERIRLYRGFRLANNASVLIKEYQLTELHPREVKQVKEQLERLESVSLKSGGVQDFRFIVPWDTAIEVDQKRGYLIIRQPPDGSLTLRQYLMRSGAMTPLQVRGVLSQVLQSLWFLHTHAIRFADGTVQRGLVHGNLNLDSLLLVQDGQLLGGNDAQFQIHLQDFALWDAPFQRSPGQTTKPSAKTPQVKQSEFTPELIQQELKNLGTVAFYLLIAEIYDRYPTPPFDPIDHPKWPEIRDQPLKQFIRQLLGLDPLPFHTAEEACRALRELPEPVDPIAVTEPTITSSQQQTPIPMWLRWLPLLLLIGILAWLLWWLFGRSNQGGLPLITQSSYAIREVDKLNSLSATQQTFTYTASDAWSDVLGKGRVSFKQNFQEVLQDRDPRLGKYLYVPRLRFPSEELPLEQLRTGKLAFVLSDWQEKLPEGFDQTIVAYDGLVIFTTFSGFQEQQKQPQRSQISIQELQKIYTDGNKNFKRYFPNDEVATSLFKQRILNDNPKLIQAFKETEISQPVNQIFEAVLKDRETGNTKSIGFGRLSKVFGQCSVYPLAIATGIRSVQPFVQDNGAPLDPTIDLCNAKGSYWPNTQVFQNKTYPLSYPLSVIYSKQNAASKQAAEAFIKVLETDEGQCLLNEAGLVSTKLVRQKGICTGIQKSGVIKQWITQLMLQN